MINDKKAKDDFPKNSIKSKNVDNYLNHLKKELKGSDPALIQDALSDAEEHLRFALNSAKIETPNIAEAEALVPIIEKYGSPSEVAAAYKKIEIHLQPVFPPISQPDPRPFISKFFSIIL